MSAPAFVVLALVALALGAYVASGEIRAVVRRRRLARPARRPEQRFDPGVERRAELKARDAPALDRQPRGMGDVPRPRLHPRRRARQEAEQAGRPDSAALTYGFLIYPHKPIVAYLPGSNSLLSEYCVEFPDRSDRLYGPKLPDSDDVLAKWMLIRADEERLIARREHAPARAPGRPAAVRRDLWRLAEWERAPGRRGPRARRVPERRRRHERRHPRIAAGAVVDGPDRAAARSYLYAIGLDETTCASRSSASPTPGSGRCPATSTCAGSRAKVKEGIRAAGGTPLEYNTIAISDGITMGTEGMKTSLVSREVIADSIELVARGHLFDAVVALSGCDKTIPGTVMALARLDVPSLMLYGGSIVPGRFEGRDVTIQDVFEAVGAHAAGTIDDEELAELEHAACPGAGACGGQFTANTMATAFEVMGISPMGSAMVPAMDPRKDEVCVEAGRARDDAARPRPAAERRDHQGLARERDRRGRRDGRLDQRRAAPARGRLRGRHRARARRLRPDQRAARRCSPT